MLEDSEIKAPIAFPPNFRMSEQCPEWKALLTELLAAIAKRLTSIEDYDSFRGVCTSWRAAATFHNFDRDFRRVPLLIYFGEETPVLGDGKIEETPVRRKKITNFLDLESNTSKSVNFPPAMGRRYLSSFGWILSVSDDSEQVFLKHFMLGININLPEVKTLPFITKMVLSGSPIEAEADVLVMVIWGFDDQLAFCRLGDESWTLMDWWDSTFCDIIYHNSKLYALDYSLAIVECDVHGSNPTKLVEVFEFPHDDMMKIDCVVITRFLVESFGKFLIVIQYFSQTGSHNFRIIEIELNDGSYEKIDNLGKCSLFLGLNSSICVDVPASSSVKLNPNCIYLGNVNIYSVVQDVGVYTLCDGCYEDFSGMLFCCDHPPSVWVVPTI